MNKLRDLLEVISIVGADGIPLGLSEEQITGYCELFLRELPPCKYERICDCKHTKEANYRCYNCGYNDSRKDIVE